MQIPQEVLDALQAVEDAVEVDREAHVNLGAAQMHAASAQDELMDAEEAAHNSVKARDTAFERLQQVIRSQWSQV